MKYVKAKVKKIQILSSRALHSVAVIFLIYYVWLHGLQCAYPKPGSKSLNLSLETDSFPAQNFRKLEILQGYISRNKVDILCFSEIFLNSDISCDVMMATHNYQDLT